MASIPYAQLSLLPSCTLERLATGKANQESPRLCWRPPGANSSARTWWHVRLNGHLLPNFHMVEIREPRCAGNNHNQWFPYEWFPMLCEGLTWWCVGSLLLLQMIWRYLKVIFQLKRNHNLLTEVGSNFGKNVGTSCICRSCVALSPSCQVRQRKSQMPIRLCVAILLVILRRFDKCPQITLSYSVL